MWLFEHVHEVMKKRFYYVDEQHHWYDASPTKDIYSSTLFPHSTQAAGSHTQMSLTTTTTTRLHGGARVDVYARLFTGGWHRSHAVLYLCSHCHKGLLYICWVLGTGFQEWEAMLITKFLIENKIKIVNIQVSTLFRENLTRWSDQLPLSHVWCIYTKPRLPAQNSALFMLQEKTQI